MQILIAPDKFKGSLTAPEAAQAIAKGIRREWPDAKTVCTPIADGGEGTSEAIRAALGGERITVPANDPLGREVDAGYVWLDGGVAVIDMCEASGLWRLSPEERDPMRANTHGTGQLMADALRRGATKILVGLGGSATNDAGAGMAEALGFQFLGCGGKRLSAIPANFAQIERMVAPSSPLGAEVVALSDVLNPLTGERGASRLFGPQKGADAAAVARLDEDLGHLADVLARETGRDFRDTPGAGAAGGLGFGLMSFCRAALRSGFETIAEILRLEEKIAASGLVVTGEGCLDVQTLEGKGPGGIALLARKFGKPAYAFAGMVRDAARDAGIFQETFAVTPEGMPMEEAIRNAPRLLEESAAQWARRLMPSR